MVSLPSVEVLFQNSNKRSPFTMKTAAQRHIVNIDVCSEVCDVTEDETKNNPSIIVTSKKLEVKTNATHDTVEKETKKQINKDTEAYRAIKQSFDFIEMFGIMFGATTNYKWKRGTRYWLAISYLMFTWSQFFYSQYKYTVNGEHKKIFEVFAVYGIAISCVLKIKNYGSYFKELAAINGFIFKICRENVGRRGDKLKKQINENFKFYKFFTAGVLLSGLIFVFYPIGTFIGRRELNSLLPIEIMYADQSTLSGFLVANTFMAVMGIYALIGSIYMGLHFIAAILNYALIVTMIEIDIKEFNGFWDDKTTTTTSERHTFLRNICQKCQDKDNYIREIKKIFDNKIYLYFCFAYFSQIICLYEVKVENWISGYGIAYGLFVEMMFYCFLGSRITIENERLCYVITQSNWYTFDTYSQKIWLTLLHSSMNTKELWIGPLAPLSVFTGSEIVKSIYSYYTILMDVM